jgi:hypothetical protein
MMQTLLPGNNRSPCSRCSRRRSAGQGERGFILSDALLCLFVTGVILLVLQGASVSLSRFVFKAVVKMYSIIEERNRIETNETDVNSKFFWDGENYETP